MRPLARLWNLILLSAAFIHTLIAWSMWVAMPSQSTNASPASVLMRQYAPDELWPILFFICGLLAAAGLWSAKFARAHFVLGGTIMLLWASVILLFSRSPVSYAGGLLLLHFSVLKFALAYYVPQLERIGKVAYIILGEISNSHARN